jgi:hypothetical protein
MGGRSASSTALPPLRLGLYNYDFVNHEILGTAGFGEPSGEIFGHLVAAVRSGDTARISDAFVKAYQPA